MDNARHTRKLLQNRIRGGTMKGLSLAKRKGLSAPIGMIFVLMIMMAIIIPMMYYVNSMPSNEAQAQENAQPYFTQAQEQLQEVNTQSSPVGFYYDNTTGEAYIVCYSTPPIPINVSYFIGELTGIGHIVHAEPVKTTFNNYPALEYQVGRFNELAMITTLGNIIYSDPMPIINNNDGNGKQVVVDPMWLFKLNQYYGSYTNPSSLTADTDPDALVQNYEYNEQYNGVGGYSDSGALIIRENENGWINISAYIMFYPPIYPSTKNTPDTIGLEFPNGMSSYYEQIEFYSYLDTNVWPQEGIVYTLFNASPVPHYLSNRLIGVIAGYPNVLATSKGFIYQTPIPNHYEIDLHLIGNQIYVYMYYQNGSNWQPFQLPAITPEYDKGFVGFNNDEPASEFYNYEGNYSTSIWGSTPLFLQVGEQEVNPAPFGGILAKPVFSYSGSAEILCGFQPIEYPYDPIPLGSPIEIIWGNQVIVQSIQTDI